MKQTIILKQNGDIITFNLDSINLNLCDVRFTNSLERTIPRRGFKESFDSIHKFYFKKSILVIWGYRDGNPTTENRHELPPPLDNTLLFGDCLVIQYDEYGNQISLNPLVWEEFYSTSFGGFYDLGSEDSELSDPEDMWRFESEDDPDYEPPSHEESSEEYYSDKSIDSEDY